jgi:hypothetical protein
MKVEVGKSYRVKWSIGFPDMVGKVVTVTGIKCVATVQSYPNVVTVCEVLHDGNKVLKRASANERARFRTDTICFTPRPDQLEPIIDDGRKVVAWSECLWNPSMLENQHA